MGYDGSLKFDTKIDESGFNSGVTKLGSLAKSGLAVLGGAVAGCVASFGALTKASLDSVASLEQNVGGVETLFKDSADTVIAYANKAYETAGMSANEYMSTVTSFSASLLQSLGSDTKKAAEYADRAIIDMSDNANKMGTSMELIQNAYQGFAKQNYTMLDNLKLGYGGTKTEMQRLIKDAAALKDVQAELGVTVDANSLSFGNIVNAISVMQKSMGIAGTTAKEAATTIEGSMNSAKAAFDNFLNGTASVDELTMAFNTAGTVITENLTQIIPRLAETVPAAIKAMIPMVSELGGSLAEAGMDVMRDFASGVSKSAPQVAKKAGEITSKFISGIQESAPEMLAAAANLLASFISGIGSQLPELVPQALQMVVTLADAVISNIPTIVEAGISLLSGLTQGILNALPTLIEEGPRIINEFANAIYSGIGQLITTGLQMITSLAQGLWENRGLILENAGQILMAIINVFSLSKLVSLGKNLMSSLKSGMKEMLPHIKEAGQNVITNLVNGIKALITHPVTTVRTILTNIKTAITGVNWSSLGSQIITKLVNGVRALATHPISTVKGIITNIKSAFTGTPWATIGQNIISGIANGIKAGVGSIITAAKNAAQNALDAAKSALGIHSPSTVFRDVIGKNMALGIGVGFEDNMPAVNADIDKSIENAIARAQNGIRTTQDVKLGISSIVKNVYKTYTSENVTTERDKKQTDTRSNADINGLIDRMIDKIVEAFENMGVYMDSTMVGKLVTEPVIEEMGRIGNRRT